MTSTLHDQLSQLADQAGPPPTATPGPDLWIRGIRYRRRLRAGTVTIIGAAVATLATITGVTVESAGPAPAPAPANAPIGLPSRIHVPSPWLPGSDEVGPPGQTVALLIADRGGWSGTATGVVAVSAATGDYRFLDLPDWERSEFPVLSPDGRHVAYWAAGPTTGTPNTEFTDGSDPIAGLAVYDTATGDVVRHTFPTEHGLWPEGLSWGDASRLYVDYYQLVAGDDGDAMDRGSGTDHTFWEWEFRTSQPEPWDFGERHQVSEVGIPAGGRQTVLADRGLWILEAGSAPLRVSQTSRVMYDSGHAISPDGAQIAGIWGNVRSPNHVVVLSSLRAGGFDAERLRTAGSSFTVHGWTDENHVAVTRRSEPVREGYGMAVYSVDATTGEVDQLVRLPDDWLSRDVWASDLLGAPVVDRPAPPTPLDPRVVTVLACGALVAAGLALWRWRRRVAP